VSDGSGPRLKHLSFSGVLCPKRSKIVYRRLTKLAVGPMVVAVTLLVAAGPLLAPSAHAAPPASGAAGGTSIVVSKSAATVGGSFVVTGTGFGRLENITIRSGGEVLGIEKSTASGSFSKVVTVPGSLATGRHAITATDTSGRSTSIDIRVLPAACSSYGPTCGRSLAESQTVATVGGSFTVTGRGFDPAETVTIDIHSVEELLGTTVSTSSGTFSKVVTIPRNLSSGRHVIKATDTSGQSESLYIQVVAATKSPPGAPFTASPSGSHGFTGTDIGLTVGAVAVIAAGGLLVLGLRRRRSGETE
jgi:hypothetical protein